MKRPWTGRLHRNASGRASYEVFEAEADFLTELSNALGRLGFAPQRPPIVGLDQVFEHYSNGDVRLTAGWDNWSGCFVFAWEPEGDRFVEEVGRQIDLLLADRPPVSDEVLNDAVHLALEWGEHWGKPVDSRLMAKHPSVTPAEARQADQLCREVMSYSFDQIAKAYLGQTSREEAVRNVRTRYPWLAAENLSRLENQGMYYAWKDNG